MYTSEDSLSNWNIRNIQEARLGYGWSASKKHKCDYAALLHHINNRFELTLNNSCTNKLSWIHLQNIFLKLDSNLIMIIISEEGLFNSVLVSFEVTRSALNKSSARFSASLRFCSSLMNSSTSRPKSASLQCSNLLELSFCSELKPLL